MVRSTVRILCLAGSLASLATLPLGAQEKSTKETKAANTVPQSAQPPAGLCRVWLENVPASQQPAPTDCATAIKNRPQNAKIVFGNLKDEAVQAPKRSNAAPSQSRMSGWPTRSSDTHPSEARPSDRSVRPATSTTPVVHQPSPDSGPKRRP